LGKLTKLNIVAAAKNLVALRCTANALQTVEFVKDAIVSIASIDLKMKKIGQMQDAKLEIKIQEQSRSECSMTMRKNPKCHANAPNPVAKRNIANATRMDLNVEALATARLAKIDQL
jgi:hypothetical protein